MELFTLGRDFIKVDVIDKFQSAIWTERYYGDSELELVVEPTTKMIQSLAKGTFVGLVGSDEIMMLETMDFNEEGQLKVTGISLLNWLNNRFIRASASHEDRYWPISGLNAGRTLWWIVQYMCVTGPYLDGTIDTGIDSPELLAIPGLRARATTDIGWGFAISVAVPYGPVYDALKEIATTYEIGMKIVLISADETGYVIEFQYYKGIDRSSMQHVNPVVRFSADMDSFAKIKEFQSLSNYKTQVYAFAPSNPGGLADSPGFDGRVSIDESYTGFDRRVELIFADDITTDQVGADAGMLLDMLNSRAKDALNAADIVSVVDGEIVPGVQFKYGTDYNLGDLVEVQGKSGTVKKARITEHIRVQDKEGERAFPTLTAT